jgi:type I restriction enzyme R subunit
VALRAQKPKVYDCRSQKVNSRGQETIGVIKLSNEATARLKINKLLEAADWRLLDSAKLKANVVVEDKSALNESQSPEDKTHGFLDYLLLDGNGQPLAVLEAKATNKDPVIGKEQAANYAKSKNCRFIILSNGDIHYLWDLNKNAEKLIQKLPSQESLRRMLAPRKTVELSSIDIDKDWIAKSQGAGDPADIRYLRHYQLDAIKVVSQGYDAGQDRFLLEMATGTGKTLLAAAISKLFLTSGVARRVLFLVDRIELADQAKQNLSSYLKEYNVSIFREGKEQALQQQIVVATIQSLSTNQNYLTYFQQTDFDLLISDEAHRSIYGQNRAIFEYFDAVKIGLTATPKDYLKGTAPVDAEDNELDARELERRILLDTYETFGCKSGEPSFRFDLRDAVSHDPPYLVNPVIFDKRSDKTNQMMSADGWKDIFQDGETGESVEAIVKVKHLERTVFSHSLNKLMVHELVRSAKRDPITGEIGKTLVYCISQAHASKITRLLNEYADSKLPNKYGGMNGAFARQVTSNVEGSQELTKKFRNNQLGSTRIAVTVNMMTTGYDCPDLLNVVLMRPVFSVADFIQIKGRGTRLHTFTNKLTNESINKDNFHLLDFFGVCEYFEEEYDYSEPLNVKKAGLPQEVELTEGFGAPVVEEPISIVRGNFVYVGNDFLVRDNQIQIGDDCMKVDREAYTKEFELSVRELIESDTEFAKAVLGGDAEETERIAAEKILERPKYFFTLEALRKAYSSKNLLNEFIQKAAGVIENLPDKYAKLNSVFQNFLVINPSTSFEKTKYYQNIFQCYVADQEYRDALEGGNFAVLDDQTKGGNVPAGMLTRDDLDTVINYLRKTGLSVVN